MKLISDCAALILDAIVGIAATSGPLKAQTLSLTSVVSNFLPDAPIPQPLDLGNEIASHEDDDSLDGSKKALLSAPANISGTVTDLSGDLVSGATVMLDVSATSESLRGSGERYCGIRIRSPGAWHSLSSEHSVSGSAERMLTGIAQEFVLPRFTPKAAKNSSVTRDTS